MRRKDFRPDGDMWVVWVLLFWAIFITAMLLALA